MTQTATHIASFAAKSWANPIIRRLVVVAVVAVVGFTGLEVSETTVEAIGAAAMLVISE